MPEITIDSRQARIAIEGAIRSSIDGVITRSVWYYEIIGALSSVLEERGVILTIMESSNQFSVYADGTHTKCTSAGQAITVALREYNRLPKRDETSDDATEPKPRKRPATPPAG